MILEGGLLDALCAEPAIDTLCRQSPGISLTVASPHADIYVGHPGVSGILYPDADTPPAGFQRCIVVPAAPPEATLSERIAAVAEALGVRPDRCRPHIHLTGLDAMRAERIELGRAEQPVVALCLSESENPETDQRRRWEAICQCLEESRNAVIVLLAGASHKLRVHKNLAGRLMPREMAAVLNRCRVWLGDDPTCAALAEAVGAHGVFVSDTAFVQPGTRIGVCSAQASDQQILDAIDSVRRDQKQLNGSQ